MEFITTFYNEHKFIIIVITISLIYLTIYSNLLGTHLKEYIQENWNKFKNNPFLIPFSGILGKGKGKKSNNKIFNNFNSFFSNLIKNFIGIFIKPFVYFIKLVTKVIHNIKNTLNNFRTMAQVIRNLFENTVSKTVERITNSLSAIRYYQEKFKLLIKKQTALFSAFMQFSKSLKYIFYSFSNGPIPKMVNFAAMYLVLSIVFLAICLLCIVGGPFVKLFTCPICLLCFDENTEIIIDNTKKIKIKDIKINDFIHQGGKVNGIIKVKVGNTVMYNYNGTIVSGSHLVYENSKYIRVENSKMAEKIKYNKNNLIYCLITENNKIVTNTSIFSDYQETNNIYINNRINHMILNKLNNGAELKFKNDILHTYYWGFPKSSLNFGKSFDNLNVGDKITDNNTILGICQISAKNVILYNYKDVIVSGNQIVNENGLWIRVHNSIYSKKIVNNYKYLYHIITDSNTFLINNIQFRDFCETNEEKVNNEIDNLVENFLNCK